MLRKECLRKKIIITSLVKGVENKNEVVLRMKKNFDQKIQDLLEKLAANKKSHRTGEKVNQQQQPNQDTQDAICPPLQISSNELFDHREDRQAETTQQIDLWKIQGKELGVFFKSFEKTQAMAKRLNLRNSFACAVEGEALDKNASLMETQRNFNQSWDNLLASKETINLRDSIFAKRKATVKRIRGGNSAIRYEISDFNTFNALDFEKTN